MATGDQLMKRVVITLVAVLFLSLSASAQTLAQPQQGPIPATGTAGQPACYTGTNAIGSCGTQATSDNSTLPATDAYVNTAMAEVRVEQASPAVAYGGTGCTLTFTNATNTVTYASCSVDWSSLQVGTILAYTGVTPNFRAAVLSVNVSTKTLTVGAYFPGTTATNTASWTDTGGDLGGQLNAALQNSAGTKPINAASLGSQSATFQMTLNPFIGLPAVNPIGFGKVILPNGQISLGEPLSVIGYLDLGGQGKQQPTFKPGAAWATYNNSVNNVASTTLTSTAGNATITDSSQTFNIVASAPACIGSTPFGIITLASAPSAGFSEGAVLTLYNITNWAPAGGLSLPITAVAGTSATLNFTSTCPSSPSVGTNPGADVISGDVFSGFQASSASNLTDAAGTKPKLWVVTSSGTPFLATDVGTATVSVGGTAYDIVSYTSSSVVSIIANADPGWSASAGNVNRWITGQIVATSPTAVTTFTVNPKAQSSIASGTFTYSISPYLISWESGINGQGTTVQGTHLHDFQVNGSALPDISGISFDLGQEQGYTDNVSVNAFTAYGMACEVQCLHFGPWKNGSVVAATSVNVAPTGAGFFISNNLGNVNGPWDINGITFTAATGNGPMPFTAVEYGGAGMSIIGLHCEDYPWCIRVGQYNSAIGSFLGVQPGVLEYGGILLTNKFSIDVAISGVSPSNAFQGTNNSAIEDDNVASTCGSGTTYVTDGSAAIPFVGLYSLSTTSGQNVRRTSDANVAPCGGIGAMAGSVSVVGQTSAISTAPLCNSGATNGCGVAGQYRVDWNILGNGTFCATPAPGGVTLSLTWSDDDATHTAVIPAVNAQTGTSSTAVNVTAPTMAFQGALAQESASGSYVLRSAGSAAIQYAVAYTACGVGTGSFNFLASVTRLQ